MQLVKMGGVALNQIPLDWQHNKENIIQALKKAKDQKVAILCFPELCITGYGCEDMFLSSAIHQKALAVLCELLPYTFSIITCFGLPIVYQNRVFNTMAVVADGSILGFVAKQHLPYEGIHYENRWFTPWPAGKSTSLGSSRLLF